MIYCRDEDRWLLGETIDKLNRWVHYFEQLLNEEVETEKQTSNYQQESGIPAEILKHGGVELCKSLHNLVLKIWKEENMPEQWSRAVICSIFKKGNKTLCENYRGIPLFEVTYKS